MISVDRSSRQALLDAAKVEKGRDMSRDPVNGSHSANDTIFANLFGRKVFSAPRPEGAAITLRRYLGVSTHKKALVSRFDREALSGFVNPQGYLLAQGLELMTQSGSVRMVPYDWLQLVGLG